MNATCPMGLTVTVKPCCRLISRFPKCPRRSFRSFPKCPRGGGAVEFHSFQKYPRHRYRPLVPAAVMSRPHMSTSADQISGGGCKINPFDSVYMKNISVKPLIIEKIEEEKMIEKENEIEVEGGVVDLADSKP